MKPLPPLLTLVILCLALTSSGCFRVSSDTQALRDAVLSSGNNRAHQRVEIGVGFFTVGLAKLVTRVVEVPEEARTALSALRKAECAVYEVARREDTLSSILANADEAMAARHCERLVGVIKDQQLVAIYVPIGIKSPRNMKVSVLVLDRHQLVCVTAEADAHDLFDLVRDQLEAEIGKRPTLASARH